VWHELEPACPPTAVLALAADGGSVYAGGTGGVARLEGEDGRWQPCVAGLHLGAVSALAAQEGLLLAGGVGGIMRSGNRGRHWRRAELAGPAPQVTALASVPDGLALAATLGAGVLRSDDGGRSWATANFGLADLDLLAVALAPAGQLALVASGDGIYRSPNGGRAWRAGAGSEGLLVATLALLPAGDALALLEDGALLRSDDGGASWALHDAPLPKLMATALLAAGDALLLGSTSHGLLRSNDGGLSWQAVAAEPVLALAAAQEALYAGTSAGLMRSDDGGLSWQALAAPPVHDLRRLLVAGGQLYLSGTHAGLLRHVPSGGWQPVTGTPQPLAGLAVAPDAALVAAAPAGLYRLASGAGVWERVAEGSFGASALLSFGQDGAGYAASGDGQIWLRSDDGGLSWRSLPAPFGVLMPIALQALRGAALAVTYDVRRQLAQPWRSRDGGLSWERGAEEHTPWPLAATFDHPPLLSLGATLHLERGAGDWPSVRVGGPGSALRRVVGMGPTLLALASDGLYRSDDGGLSWRSWAEAPPADEVLDIALHERRVFLLRPGGRVCWSALEEAAPTTGVSP
jgi:photosystem II stability/assembly factor-like uncharacterized protein